MATTPKRVVELLKQEIPAKISLNQFCKKTGINPNSVDKYLAGVTEPTQASLEKIAAYFGTSAAELRGERDLYGIGFYKDQVAIHLDKGREQEEIICIPMDTIVQLGISVATSIVEGRVSKDLLAQLQPFKREVEHIYQQHKLGKDSPPEE